MAEKLYRRTSVECITGLSRSSIYQQMNDKSFPRPIRIGRRAVAWRESDIEAWLAARPIATT
ncbi:helix-turn-helix transcriptional regulator [Nioella sediminis]|uniref:helix-turn-helix transcriptional regulator n=1 Tax=Nioella sediminis TaxID=1912092 RepID=UPI0008FD65B1|nr:AlpA family phage regulatory protein [Nioella sediminis]TBX28730.1 DNA-binding protein [Roseovarius sp. JS7-11]